jgi:hypothetical protein
MTQIYRTGIFRSRVAGTMRGRIKSAGPLLESGLTRPVLNVVFGH